LSETVNLSDDALSVVPTAEEVSSISADFAAKRWCEVASAARKLTERFPDHEFGWRALGSVLYLIDDVAGALMATERAVALLPRPDSRCNLARLYLHQKQYLRALGQCKMALAETPNLVEARKLGNDIKAMLKHPDVIADVLRERVLQAPGDISAHIGLAIEDMNQGRLPDVLARLRHALLLGLARTWQESPKTSSPRFDTVANLRVFRQTLVSLAAVGVQAFATSGTLLGLEREGRLLSFDKDLDIGLPMAQMEQACGHMVAQGWVEQVSAMGFINPRSFKHCKLHLSIDLFGFKIEKASGLLIGGIWSSKLPWLWQRVTEFSTHLALHKERHHYGEIWALDEPDVWLSALYGDWRTPDPNFDAVISAYNLRGFSLLTESFALLRINQALVAGKLQKALSLVQQTRRHLPADKLLERVDTHVSSLLAK
jgi:tetratricopeptide (TPR) repeat protein